MNYELLLPLFLENIYIENLLDPEREELRYGKLLLCMI